MLVVGAGVGYGDGAPSITQGGPLNGLVHPSLTGTTWAPLLPDSDDPAPDSDPPDAADATCCSGPAAPDAACEIGSAPVDATC